MTNSKILIPILGDQLSFTLSSLQGIDPAQAVLLLCEVEDETRYVRHHKAKIAFILASMRHHAEALRRAGWTVDYVRLDDPENSGSFTGEVARALERHKIGAIRVTEAGEWRVQAMLENWAERFAVPVTILSDTRFIASHADFAAWAGSRKHLRMEYFYREMRRKTGLLMTAAGQPEGGQWNYDGDNRKPAKGDAAPPAPLRFAPDAISREVIAMVAQRFAEHPGNLAQFNFAVTRADAQRAADHFLAFGLPHFGDFQDAMLTDQPFLWHSLLAPYLNNGLLDPLALCQAVAARYAAGAAPLNAAEGFIRQIIGWREFVRGIYWREGPGYATRNALNARRDLPGFYYDGDTDLHCLRQAIGQTLVHSYAHHIQRLMITGNFAMLAGVDPVQVHHWYLEVYADAYEWVELPNVLGMSQFADGGVLASKPYAASGNYIDKMSNYCRSCRYDVRQKTGPDACPFNALYWDFLARNRDILGGNHRLAMPYRNWDRKSAGDQSALRAAAAAFLHRIG